MTYSIHRKLCRFTLFFLMAFNLTLLKITLLPHPPPAKGLLHMLPQSPLEPILMHREIPSLRIFMDCSHHLPALVETGSPKHLAFPHPGVRSREFQTPHLDLPDKSCLTLKKKRKKLAFSPSLRFMPSSNTTSSLLSSDY